MIFISWLIHLYINFLLKNLIIIKIFFQDWWNYQKYIYKEKKNKNVIKTSNDKFFKIELKV